MRLHEREINKYISQKKYGSNSYSSLRRHLSETFIIYHLSETIVSEFETFISGGLSNIVTAIGQQTTMKHFKTNARGAWVAQSVKHGTLAQVMISPFLSLSPPTPKENDTKVNILRKLELERQELH